MPKWRHDFISDPDDEFDDEFDTPDTYTGFQKIPRAKQKPVDDTGKPKVSKRVPRPDKE